MKVLIITGGSSSERKISLISARAVKEGLEANGHTVVMFDFKKGYKELKKDLPKYDLVFPVMHGREGEDGKLYHFLHASKKQYVGADPKGARLASNKISFKKYCDLKKIPTSAWKTVKDIAGIKGFGFPCVLKAAHGGSSHEVVLLHSAQELSTAKVQKILKLKNNRCFVEALIKGTEITVGVLGNKALPVLEIKPPKGQWFDYKNKYSGKTKEVLVSRSISPNVQRQAQRLAVAMHTHLKLGHFSRTDIIVQDNIPYVIETNTPGGVGLTSESLFPKAAKAAGLSFRQLMERLIVE